MPLFYKLVNSRNYIFMPFMVYGFLISTNVLFWHFEAKAIHPTYSSNIKCAGMGLNGFIFRKINENENIKEKKNLGAV